MPEADAERAPAPSPRADLQSPLRVALEESGGALAITVDGVVQSVQPGTFRSRSGYWGAMLPERRPAHALILGLGGGTLASLLHERFGPLRIVGVDHDPLMPELGRLRFGLDVAEVEVVEADALVFVAESAERFDYIAVDLYTADRFEPAALRRPFLRRLAERLTPGGSAVFNLWRDRRLTRRLERLNRVLPVRRRIEVDSNVVVHCGPPEPAADSG